MITSASSRRPGGPCRANAPALPRVNPFRPAPRRRANRPAAVYTGLVADFADLRLDRPDAPSGVKERSRFAARTPAAILIVLGLAALGVYLVWPRQPAQRAASTPDNA